MKGFIDNLLQINGFNLSKYQIPKIWSILSPPNTINSHFASSDDYSKNESSKYFEHFQALGFIATQYCLLICKILLYPEIHHLLYEMAKIDGLHLLPKANKFYFSCKLIHVECVEAHLIALETELQKNTWMAKRVAK